MKNTPQLQSCWENRIPFPYIINLTFRTFQFGIPFLIFFIFKALLAIYVLVWLIIYVDPGIVGFPRILDTERVYAYLSNWTYILLFIYLWASLLDISYMTYKHIRNGDLRSLKTILGSSAFHGNTVNEEKGQSEWSEPDGTEAVSNVERQMGNSGSNRNSKLAWYHKVVWVLHDMTSGICPMVSIKYKK